MEISTSFTQRIKEELCDLPFDETRDKSLLSSFVRVNGNIVFAKGSLKAAKFLINQNNGLYNMKNLI